MARINWILVVVLFLEVAVGAALFLGRRELPHPPLPVLAEHHSLGGEFRKLVANCESLDDWHTLAEIYTAYGFYAESEACYEFLLTHRTNDPELLFEFGFLLSQMGRCDKAHEQFIAAIEAGHPEPSTCWYFAGRNLLRAERPEEAADAFAQTSDISSSQLELARLRYRAGDAGGALRLLESVLKEEPSKIEPNTLAYLCELELGHMASASRFSEQAAATADRIRGPFYTQWNRLELALSQVGFRNRLTTAQALAKKNRRPIPEATFEEAMDLEWNEHSAVGLAELAESRGDYQRAATLWQEIIDRRGPSTVSLARLADNYVAMNDIPQAIDRMLEAVESQSEEDLTEAYEKLANWSEALEHYEQAEQYSALQTYWTGKVAFWQADWNSAKVHLTAASGQLSDFNEVWFFLGETHRQLNETQQALAAYQRCLSLNSQHGGARRGLSRLSDVVSIAP
ncbi:MAG: tetratricopeptide repeat protein [Planctomycetaceae bacterium]|nr:tetratricopeptide repeat protein [Planctomycetales bacterium]MCB9927270.1 tetratricopeptide repeat protein [Planctomycetaceae bacterium]